LLPSTLLLFNTLPATSTHYTRLLTITVLLRIPATTLLLLAALPATANGPVC
tara:strand:+ start:631 stop:786 length:156 start_codon:yes stop_codon:yes gene_type:complete